RIPRDGAPERPIVLRGPRTGAAILDGGGHDTLIDATDRAYVWFERLHWRRARILLQAAGARDLVIRRNVFEVANVNLAAAIEARGHGHGDDDDTGNVRRTAARGLYITDNDFIGPNTWPRRFRRKSDAERIFGVAIAGAGHVIAYNRMRDLGDGINNGRGGLLSATDIHNNDIANATDDCIEADHTTTNVRVYRNRLTNCFAGISVQPARGGPVYIFRNRILNSQYAPFKLHNDTAGVLLFHNTSIKAGIPFDIRPGHETVNDVLSRNNIFIGTTAPALRSTGRMIRTDFDNDGYAWPGGLFAVWNGVRYAAPPLSSDPDVPYGRRGIVVLDPATTFAAGTPLPDDPGRAHDPARNAPLLAPDAPAVDRGVVMPNFDAPDPDAPVRGAGPDLGCCELGVPLPFVGPRPQGPGA
ncbi:MAG: right-handed parallel beta-helix repeat-containing protein, partial [Alphaproteobacteria bacterium]